MAIQAQAPEEGDRDSPPLEEPSEVNTDVSLPLLLPQSNLPVGARLSQSEVGKKLQKSIGSFLSSKEATESHSFQSLLFPNSDIL